MQLKTVEKVDYISAEDFRRDYYDIKSHGRLLVWPGNGLHWKNGIGIIL